MMPDTIAPHPGGLRCLTTMLWVSDLDRAIQFYEEKLGAGVVRRDHAWNVVALRLPCGADLSIRQDHPGRPVTRAGIAAPYVVFQSDNPERERQAFVAKQIKVTELQQLEGLQLFWFSDPDDNQFCVLQFVYL
ncbi:VOC family protein [candidate division KSB1 bacterium]|nr:VOC family protein [candidate division KSB1 bacterium]